MKFLTALNLPDVPFFGLHLLYCGIITCIEGEAVILNEFFLFVILTGLLSLSHTSFKCVSRRRYSQLLNKNENTKIQTYISITLQFFFDDSVRNSLTF
jgi:hypothetical protein